MDGSNYNPIRGKMYFPPDVDLSDTEFYPLFEGFIDTTHKATFWSNGKTVKSTVEEVRSTQETS